MLKETAHDIPHDKSFWFHRLGLFLINEVHECIELVYIHVDIEL